MNYQIILIGGAGHGRVITDIARERGYDVLGFLDDDESHRNIGNFQRLGPIADWEVVLEKHREARFVFGFADNAVRQEIVAKYPDIPVATLVHPRTFIARNVKIGQGTVVMAGSVVNDGCKIGSHCVLNTGSLLDHDSVMDCYSSMGPGSVAGGHVTIGEQSFIGIGASIIHGISIGKGSLLAAGATLVRDLPDQVVAMGVPAKVTRSREIGERYL